MKQDHGIYRLASPPGAQMEVRAGHAAGSPAETETLSLPDPVSHLYLYFGKVHVLGRELLPVVDYDQVAFKEHGLRDDHLAVIGGQDRRSRGGVKVSSTVDAGKLAVEHATGPERVGCGEGHG